MRLLTLLVLSIGAILPACLPEKRPVLPGYVEGEFVTLAPEVSGLIVEIFVREGQHIQDGQRLAKLDPTAAGFRMKQAQARIAEARALLSNLKKGGQPEEIHSLEAIVSAAGAEFLQAENDLERTSELFRRGVISEARYKTAMANMDRASAVLEEARAKLELALSPSRADLIEAQRQRVIAAEAELALTEWGLDRHSLVAPVAGTVETLIRHPGEQAGPQAPILTLLPDGAVRVIFFATEVERTRLVEGGRVPVVCEGCPEDLSARISSVATSPEFTPPVIFSEQRRQKLSFRVEAIPEGDRNRLMPGQIVSVRLSDAVD